MAAKNLQPVRALGKEYVPIPFSFAPNGASAITAPAIKGEGIQSVARAGVGQFTVVLNAPWADVIAVSQSIQLNADADVSLSSWNYVPATRTLTLNYRTAGAAADVAANANNRLGAVIWAKNSSVGK